ncbi:MAG: glycosyltransferase family 2 protein [Opitutales bacterium]
MTPLDQERLVLIPAFNAGALLEKTVRGALEHWRPVWVVDDGSTDGSVERLGDVLSEEPGFHVMRLQQNKGKGAALFAGAREALGAGYTHILTMDADDQHDAGSIERFMVASRNNPEALIMGRPRFGEDVPRARLWGRQLSIFWTELETGFRGLGDTLFGFRVYPLAPFCRALEETSWARGFDFDPEIAVRLCWAGLRPISVDTPVRYHDLRKGGVSHFHYFRDNLLLTWLHFRLVPEMILRKLGKFFQ